MNDLRSLELAWEKFEHQIKGFLPDESRHKKILDRIVDAMHELSILQADRPRDARIQDVAQKYFGLDPLKISVLNSANRIEADEARILELSLTLTHKLILANLLSQRIASHPAAALQLRFSSQELAHFSASYAQMKELELDRIEEETLLKNRMGALRSEYEMHLFAESSHEAARSFGRSLPDPRDHYASWVAFSKFLTAVAVHVHEKEKSRLIAKCRRVAQKRQSLFESCAELLAKSSGDVRDKKSEKQLRSNLAEIKKLEAEIAATLAELSVPGIHDFASFIMKKIPDESKTFGQNIISQSTGEKKT